MKGCKSFEIKSDAESFKKLDRLIPNPTF